MTATLTLIRPDDWHVHLRDGAALAHTVAASARYFGRAIVMPNLVPPARTSAEALAYRERILAARPAGSAFEPLMVLYLTDNTDPAEIVRARASGLVHAVKLYPAGATTNSDSGVTDLEKTWPVLEKMAETGMPLLVHGEVTHADIDIFDREKVFIDTVLAPLLARLPTLKVVLEHITTADICVTADIPLASRCLKKGATVLRHNGKPFDETSIGMALGMRDLHKHLRETGMQTFNAGFTKQDRSSFLNSLETAIQQKKRSSSI